MRRQAAAPSATILILMAALLTACQQPQPLAIAGIPSRFASAGQIEENFRGRNFILGDNATVALTRPVDSAKDAWLKLPFWCGVNVMVPGVLQPKEGDYYVISEARLIK